MNNIIGRMHEKILLEETYQSNEAELVAVYGRRRIGKTYLIKNFFQNKKCIYFQTTGIYKGSAQAQLARFAKELGDTFYKGAALKKPLDWMEAFDELTRSVNRLAKNTKAIIFFDELPWMATRKSGLIAALEYFWNRYWSFDNRFKLILCGSSASWIIQKIIKNRGGLHNRITRKMRLGAFSLYETYNFLKHMGYDCNYHQVLKLYMTMGGIPFYLKHVTKDLSVDQNIEELFFAKGGVFFDEFDEVFSSLFENAEHYKEIITIIAKNKDGVARKVIDAKIQLTEQGGRLTKRLENLEQAGFISSFIPFGHKKRGLFYRISDEYCYFYLRWIEPIKNQLKQGRITHYWQDNSNTSEYYNWLGHAFENICNKHVALIKNALNIEKSSLAAPWRYIPKKASLDQGTQIDLLFDRNDDAITLCEIKYSDKPFAIDKQYAAKLNARIKIFKQKTKTSKQIFLCLITASGLKATMYSEELVSNIITLNELFKPGRL